MVPDALPFRWETAKDNEAGERDPPDRPTTPIGVWRLAARKASARCGARHRDRCRWGERHAFAAVDPGAEAQGIGVSDGTGREEGVDAIGESEHGADLVARNRP